MTFIELLLVGGLLGLAVLYVLELRATRRRMALLHERLADTQRKLRHIGLISHEVAHEIKNPITAIVCSAETLGLILGDSLDKTHQDTLRYIKEHGEEVLRLVGDLLDLSRYESGKLLAIPESCRVKELLDQTLGLLRLSASRKSISIETLIDSDVEWGRVDPRHFKQILFNLVHNAVKYSAPGSVVQVQAVTIPTEYVIKILVRDCGEGIPADLMQRIFEPYAKGSKDGVGLGLSLCKSLVALNGGKLEAVSEPGKGAEFWFTIPLSNKPAEVERKAIQERRRKNGAPRPLEGCSVVILDESQNAANPLLGLLDSYGAQVKAVALVVDLIEKLKQEPDCKVVIEDPADGLYGCELTKLLRESENVKTSGVLIVTNQSPHPAVQRSAGKDFICVERPLSADRILAEFQPTRRS
jgi:nitrogen-specific signal transduction histidine kinase